MRGIYRVEGGAKKVRKSGEKLNGVMTIPRNDMVSTNTHRVAAGGCLEIE
jgi:hypothetical protein